MEKNKNYVKLCGIVSQDPTQSHTECNREYYTAILEIERASGTKDEVPMLVPERIARTMKRGKKMIAEGNVITHNECGHLLVRVKVRYAAAVDVKVECCNIAELQGYICKEPYYRDLGKREITNLIVAVNSGRHAYYVPVIVWGRDARRLAKCSVGEQVSVHGRLQSRKYIDKSIEVGTAYEVSATTIGVTQ